MGNDADQGLGDSSRLIETYRTLIDDSNGAERFWAYTTWSLLKEGYYSPDELMDLSLQHGFTLDTPITKIKRGTRIDQGVVIKNGTFIDGEDISIGAGTILDGAQISGSDVTIGQSNSISGPIRLDHLSIGSGNEIRGLSGNNGGQVAIGNYNKIQEVNVDNPDKGVIQIGDHNQLHRGLNLNRSFQKGNIRIGHYNSLGRDGGGVITAAYRFNKRWWGDVLIGSHVETTRGAEILGFSLLGWPLSSEHEQRAQELFIKGPIEEIVEFFQMLWHQDLPIEESDRRDDKKISLFGVVKMKMSCLSGRVKIRDDTRVQSSFLKNVSIRERSKIYFTTIEHDSPTYLEVNLQDRAIEHMTITGPIDWASLPTEPETDGYRKEDASFYQLEE